MTSASEPRPKFCGMTSTSSFVVVPSSVGTEVKFCCAIATETF